MDLVSRVKDLFKGRQTPPDAHRHGRNGHAEAANQSAATVSPANASDMERAAYWAGQSHKSSQEQLREWEEGMDRWFAGMNAQEQAFLKRLLRQNRQPIDSVTVSASALYRMFMVEGAGDIHLFAKRVVETNSPEQIRHQCQLIINLANIYGLETGKTALPMILALTKTLNQQNGHAPPSPFVLGTDPVSGVDLQLTPDALSKSLLLLGLSGMGKSSSMVRLARYHMEMGHTLVVIDPHGPLVKDIIQAIPEDRMDDVDVIDLMDSATMPVGLNIFECADPSNPTEVAKVAQATISIFETTWGMSTATPLLAQVVRHICYTMIESGLTLNEVGLFLFDETLRQKITSTISNQHTKLFWEQFNLKNPRQQTEYTNSTTNKLDALLTQPILSNILCQKRSTIDISRITREGRILLLLLNQQFAEASKLIGNIVLTKLLLNAFSRAENPSETHTPVALLCDEWQLFSSSSTDFARFIHESRKAWYMPCYANQSLSQLSEENIGAAMSSGTIAALRINGDDAKIVSRGMNATPQPIEVGLESQRAIVSDVISQLTKRGHEDPTVAAFAMKTLQPLEHFLQTPTSTRFTKEWHVSYNTQPDYTLRLYDYHVQRGRSLLNQTLYTCMNEAKADLPIPMLAIFVFACSQATGMEYILSPYVIHQNHGILFGPFSLRDFDPAAAKFGQPYFTEPEYTEAYIAAVSRKRQWMAEALVLMLSQLRACMRVLSSSPIMVDTGKMVPKYQLRSVSDQQNYNANSLTQQEPFNARVKTIHGEYTIRLTPPHELTDPELVSKRLAYIKQRMLERGVIRPAAEVAEELRKRHELLRGQEAQAPPSRSITNTRRPRRRPPRRDDIEEQ